MKQSIGSGRGSVYNIIMKALQSGDKYGYEICQEVETKTNGNYILKQPSLYSGLKRLEAQKLVESYWGDSDIGGRRHYYRLTEEGRKKIESTNFSWEDERNELVDSFFEKSELEKQLEEVKKDVEEISKDVENAENENKSLFEVMDSKQPLESSLSPVLPLESFKDDNEKITDISTSQVKKTSSFSHKVNENQFDLFSFTDSSLQNQEQQEVIETEQKLTENIEETVQTNEVIENQDKENQAEESTTLDQHETFEESIVAEANSTEAKQLEIENEHMKNKVEQVENETISPQQTTFDDLSSKNEIEQPQQIKEEQLSNNQTQSSSDDYDFDNYFKLHKNSSFSESQEDASPTLINVNDLEKSSTFYGSSNLTMEEENVEVEDDEFESRYKEFQKMFDEEKTEVVEENSELDERILQEKRMSDALSGNLNDSNELNSNAFITSPVQEPKKEESEINSLNLKSIFGDMMEDDKVEDLINSQNSLSENEISNNVSLKNEESTDLLPRYDVSNNVNLCLQSDYIKPQEVERKDFNDYFGPFEAKNEQSIVIEQPIIKENNTFTEKESFDKKCAKRGFNFNDYEIKYLRKNNLEQKVSRFTKINKLNFANSLCVSTLALLFVIALMVAYGKTYSTFAPLQLTFFIISLILPVAYVSFYLVRFIKNKDERKEYKFEKELFSTSLFLGILAIVILFCINLIFGLSFGSIFEFSGSLISLSINVVMFILSPIIKICFSKITYFSK
ncbi:MAG: helix-turn-helix transcriptional regulator [Clostridiales bacterium]|nr:helix-turn-helix transcriptional regulator [Candidatus Apopatousia equi]